jgi:hypothetical protein
VDLVSAYRHIALRRAAELQAGRLDALEWGERVWRMLRLAFLAAAMHRRPSHDGNLRPELRKPLEGALPGDGRCLSPWRVQAEARQGRRPEELPDIELSVPGPNLDLLALNDALTRLGQQDRRRAELVRLPFSLG